MSSPDSKLDQLDTWINVALSACMVLLVLCLFIIVAVMGWKEITR